MFEHAYRRFRENMEDLCEAACWFRWHLLQALVNLTLPLWIVPYMIWRRMRKENK